MHENYIFNTEKVVNEHKNMVVVCYDIKENKRRIRMVKLLEKYLFRVQRSVFEAIISQKKTEKLKAEISKFAQPDDNIRVYKINGAGDVNVYGTSRLIEDTEIIII